MFLTLWKPAAAIGAASIALVWTALSPAPTQAMPDLKSVFQMLDRNHDGVITMDEFQRDASDPAVEKMHHAHMSGADAKAMAASHDQMMSSAHSKPSEQSLKTHFTQIDANGDGSITYDEFKAFHERMRASHPH
jgi:Ca2+-binding EF-hand superfamily protein